MKSLSNLSIFPLNFTYSIEALDRNEFHHVAGGRPEEDKSSTLGQFLEFGLSYRF